MYDKNEREFKLTVEKKRGRRFMVHASMCRLGETNGKRDCRRGDRCRAGRKTLR
jgi:hypothetical protein